MSGVDACYFIYRVLEKKPWHHLMLESSTEMYGLIGADVEKTESDVCLMVSLRESSWRKNVNSGRD